MSTPTSKTKQAKPPNKLAFVVWYRHVGSDPTKVKVKWITKVFGCQCRSATWLDQNSRFLFIAFGALQPVKSEAELPEEPPDDAILLLGDRNSTAYSHAGRYPAADVNQETLVVG
jgi:hypothetical protein